MKRILLLGLLLLPCTLFAQSIAGTWEGSIDAGGQRLRVVFHILPSGDGYTATCDSPDQGAEGLPAASVVLRGGLVSIDLGFAVYSGALMGERRLSGTFTQGGAAMMLTLARTGDAVAPVRPQDPVPPYPYRVEEVEIPNAGAGIVLRGTLTLPEGEGPHPAVILFTGSGLQNRDEEILGHKPFLVLADCLTRRGIAVLRCDDRGYGASREELREIAGSTTLDLAEDMRCMFRFLRTRGGIDPAKIGLLGHSEGACVAVMTAAREPEAAFVVSMAGMAVRGAELMVAQNRALLLQKGLETEDTEAYCRALLLQKGLETEDTEAYCRALEHVFAVAERLAPSQIAATRGEIADTLLRGEARNLPQPLRDNLPAVVALTASPWMHFFLTYDPAADIAALGSRPLFALNGDRDVQVDAGMNLGAFGRILGEDAASATQVRRYAGLNHLFQHCVTGGVEEYGRIEETLAPEVLADIAAWIERVTGLAPGQ